jgi:hypothetical protein
MGNFFLSSTKSVCVVRGDDGQKPGLFFDPIKHQLLHVADILLHVSVAEKDGTAASRT